MLATTLLLIIAKVIGILAAAWAIWCAFWIYVLKRDPGPKEGWAAIVGHLVLWLALSLLLVSCDSRPKTAEWQDVCVQSHDELVAMIPHNYGNGVVILQPIYDTVCDRTERRCVAGRDGSTRCRKDAR